MTVVSAPSFKELEEENSTLVALLEEAVHEGALARDERDQELRRRTEVEQKMAKMEELHEALLKDLHALPTAAKEAQLALQLQRSADALKAVGRTFSDWLLLTSPAGTETFAQTFALIDELTETTEALLQDKNALAQDGENSVEENTLEIVPQSTNSAMEDETVMAVEVPTSAITVPNASTELLTPKPAIALVPEEKLVGKIDKKSA